MPRVVNYAVARAKLFLRVSRHDFQLRQFIETLIVVATCRPLFALLIMLRAVDSFMRHERRIVYRACIKYA